MLAPSRDREREVGRRGGRSQTQPIPAPVGGWNTEQALTAMAPEFACILRNWFPDVDGVRPRNGYVEQAAGLGDAVVSLMSYVSGTSKRLFAASGANIYDVSLPGTVGSPVWSSATSPYWQNANVATPGGQFVIAANGADHPINYNGSVWASTPAITGVAGGAGTIVNLFLSHKRIFLIQKDSADVYYLSPSAIGGAAALLPLGQELQYGGSIVAGGTWSSDSGAGMSDRTVFVSSEGEMLIYNGTDPSAAATWSLEGRYRIGKPIGYRCTAAFGGDLAVLTLDGLMSVAAVRQLDRTASQKGALTRSIRQAFADAVSGEATTFGWQAVGFAAGQMVIINVPNATSGETRQFVMNTLSGAWCEYTGLQASCWIEHNDKLYFGSSNGRVNEAERGSIDGSELISCFGVGAFSNLSPSDAIKTAQVLKTFSRGGSAARLYVAVGLDYDLAPLFEEYDADFTLGNFFTWGVSSWSMSRWVEGGGAESEGLIWNVGNWNEFNWGGVDKETLTSKSVFGSGRAIAVAFKAVIADGSPVRRQGLKIQRFDLTYEAGTSI